MSEEKLEELYEAKTLDKLGLILPSSKYVVYNFTNLSWSPKNTPPSWWTKCAAKDEQYSYAVTPKACTETIEFRQHEGTLHADRIANRTRFCVRIVEWAKETSREDMKAFLFPELDYQQTGHGMKLWEFVESKLGLPDVAQTWKTFIVEKNQLRALRGNMKQREQDHEDYSVMTLLFEKNSLQELNAPAEEVELAKAESGEDGQEPLFERRKQAGYHCRFRFRYQVRVWSRAGLLW